MTLSTGTKLNHYEITSQLGKGGMGEVYKAKDQKLGREVAIKVLPEEFAKDADRVARFQREAKLLASLNHPNIASIYGLEESDGTHFLVLELIEGDTLADRLKRGAIPVEESLKLALQIAEALEAAHEKGVIHRDLKPANIKVTPDGKVKVLDFGLAKAFAGEQADVNLSQSPTLSEAATLQGVILGTAAYMSPEQARGKPLDKRTDIWAFGCVFYEMLTGKAAFQGEDVTEILAAVVKSGVNLDLLPANVHPRVREVIIRCLQKEQKKRYGSIGEAHYEIEQVLADPSGIFAQPVMAAKPRRKLRVGFPWVAAIAILCVIIGAVAVWILKPVPSPEPRQVHRYDYDLPEGQEFVFTGHPILAISPDGSKFVYCTVEGIYLHSMDGSDAGLLLGTDKNSLYPFFSPDSKWVGYWSRNELELKKIATSGGMPAKICDAPSPLGPTWSIDNTIVYSTNDEGIMRVSANGGNPDRIIDRGGKVLFGPRILPDGKSVLFSLVEENEPKIAVQSIGAENYRILGPGVLIQYLPSGYLVYYVENDVFAVPFDLDTLEVKGDPVPIIEGVHQIATTTATQCAISKTGDIIYIPKIADSSFRQDTLVWVDFEGKEERIKAEPKTYDYPKISPDGTQIALSINEDGNQDIHIFNLDGDNTNRLTFDEAADIRPIWTPDSQQIIFGSYREGSCRIYSKPAGGAGKVEQITSLQTL